MPDAAGAASTAHAALAAARPSDAELRALSARVLERGGVLGGLFCSRDQSRIARAAGQQEVGFGFEDGQARG